MSAQADHATPVDGSSFADPRRFQSAEITRVFAASLRAVAQGPRCRASPRPEVPAPGELFEIVRGVD